MKRLVLSGIIAAMGIFATGSFAQIAGSKHDLSNTANEIRAANPADVNNEICVFCHTPHGSNDTFVGAPLWNKAIDTTTTTYQIYGGGHTTAGTTVGQPGDVSMACLSCHDGVNAINSIINLPGSGGWSSSPSGNLIAFTTDGGLTTIPEGTTATMPAGRITNIGDGNPNPDLRNDHPIGVAYTEGVASLRPITTDLGSLGWPTEYQGKTIENLLRGGKVECVSCHDPHLGENPTFLRLPNNNSALCLTCHDK